MYAGKSVNGAATILYMFSSVCVTYRKYDYITVYVIIVEKISVKVMCFLLLSLENSKYRETVALTCYSLIANLAK
jgi:hypothetical protein